MAEEKWIEEKGEGCIIHVFVQPRASKNEIDGIHGDAIKVRLTSPPVDGAANAMLTKFMGKILSVTKSDIRILSGDKSRKKVIQVEGVSMEDVFQRLVLRPLRERR